MKRAFERQPGNLEVALHAAELDPPRFAERSLQVDMAVERGRLLHSMSCEIHFELPKVVFAPRTERVRLRSGPLHKTRERSGEGIRGVHHLLSDAREGGAEFAQHRFLGRPHERVKLALDRTRSRTEHNGADFDDLHFGDAIGAALPSGGFEIDYKIAHDPMLYEAPAARH